MTYLLNTIQKLGTRKTSWNAVKGLDNPNESYIKFIETITAGLGRLFCKNLIQNKI